MTIDIAHSKISFHQHHFVDTLSDHHSGKAVLALQAMAFSFLFSWLMTEGFASETNHDWEYCLRGFLCSSSHKVRGSLLSANRQPIYKITQNKVYDCLGQLLHHFLSPLFGLLVGLSRLLAESGGDKLFWIESIQYFLSSSTISTKGHDVPRKPQ